MAVYKLNSTGSEVGSIQEKLNVLGFYSGAIDGNFGAATDTAVRAFQQAQGLTVDGVVGPVTWEKLIGLPVPTPGILSQSLDYRCLALTGSFETDYGLPGCFCGISGDFDGQGLSFGVLQWNFGQGSLQPLLNRMIATHPDVMRNSFQAQYDALVAALAGPWKDLMAWVRSIQDPAKHTLNKPWRDGFVALGRTREFQAIQQQAAHSLYLEAQQLCTQYTLVSERAQALMFDIKTQNGSIPAQVDSQIRADFQSLPATLAGPDLEVEKMKIIANRRAEDSQPQWIEDVRSRKLCCALGKGRVHGIDYDLQVQYGIHLS